MMYRQQHISTVTQNSKNLDLVSYIQYPQISARFGSIIQEIMDLPILKQVHISFLYVQEKIQHYTSANVIYVHLFEDRELRFYLYKSTNMCTYLRILYIGDKVLILSVMCEWVNMFQPIHHTCAAGEKGILFGVHIRKKGLRILWGKERKKEIHVHLFEDRELRFLLIQVN